MNATEETTLAVLANDMKYVQRQLAEINENVKQGYVTKDEFDPIKRLVYGTVSVVGATVIGAVLALVITGTGK